jgi:hypothetical protein
MRVLIAAMFLLCAAASARAEEVLPSRDLVFPPVRLVEPQLVDFDLIDAQTEARDRKRQVSDLDLHSIFDIKRHIGGAAGFDNGNPHASIGVYLTIAEWKRWNFGVPAAELGFGRYSVYDHRLGQSVMKDGLTLIVSLASMHYRMGYVKTFGVNWYLNLEQIYDLRNNMAGSQFGLSFSRK